MALGDFIQLLQSRVSKDTRILTDRQDDDFKKSLERWSNIDLKVPGAIVKPATEEDVILTVSLMYLAVLTIRHQS